jgi:IS30 family transposase
VYLAAQAQRATDVRASRPKPSKLKQNPQLCEVVVALLNERLSPEQVSAVLKRMFPDDSNMNVSHETIYRELYIQARGGLKKELAQYLRRGRHTRRPHGSSRGRPGVVKNMVMIKDRPLEVTQRMIPGHWEGDLIMGPANKSAMVVLIERVSNFVLVIPLPHGHTADKVASAITNALRDLPKHVCRSLTWDQGAEMARHEQIQTALGIQVYFCDPHSPWQRGSNENTNGLLRQYFPKDKSLKNYSAQYVETVQTQMNDRPRKRLGFKTPLEVFQQLLLDPDKTINDALTP